MYCSSSSPGSRPRSTRKLAAAITFAACLAPAAGHAEKLEGAVTVYGWLPWLDGSVTSNNVDAKTALVTGDTIKTSLSGFDVLDSLEFAFMGAGEVHYGKFGFLQDIVYASLGAGTTITDGPSVNADVKLLMWTTAISYKAYEDGRKLVEPYAGVRYIGFKSDVTLTDPGPDGISTSGDVDVDLWDPIVGVRARYPLTEKLTAGGFVDVGGFGVGSDLSWEIFAGLDYAFNDRFSANLGARYISLNYDGGSGEVDVDFYGPVLGLTARF